MGTLLNFIGEACDSRAFWIIRPCFFLRLKETIFVLIFFRFELSKISVLGGSYRWGYSVINVFINMAKTRSLYRIFCKKLIHFHHVLHRVYWIHNIKRMSVFQKKSNYILVNKVYFYCSTEMQMHRHRLWNYEHFICFIKTALKHCKTTSVFILYVKEKYSGLSEIV